jgi:hypothetical protein
MTLIQSRNSTIQEVGSLFDPVEQSLSDKVFGAVCALFLRVLVLRSFIRTNHRCLGPKQHRQALHLPFGAGPAQFSASFSTIARSIVLILESYKLFIPQCSRQLLLGTPGPLLPPAAARCQLAHPPDLSAHAACKLHEVISCAGDLLHP